MSYDMEEEIERLKQEISKEERRTAECQREISRLRGIVRNYSGVSLLDVEFDMGVSGQTIGAVMENAWEKALDLDVKRLCFTFNSHKITIEKEEL